METLLDTYGGRQGVKSLLLLYLFFLKAAADCPVYEGKENIVLTNEALLLNSFPEGITITLECGNGYFNESGSGSVTCNGGQWSEPTLICKKRDCGVPAPRPNMSFNISEGTLFAAAVGVICDKGYQLRGSAFNFCYAKGWRGNSKCKIVTCDIPDEVTNGSHSWHSPDDPKYGESIKYDCNDGYTLTGNDTITCSETGEYDSQPPECTEASTTTESSSSASETTHRDEPVTTTAVSPSAGGGRDVLTAEDKTTTTSVTSTTPSLREHDRHDGYVDPIKDTGYAAVICSVIGVLIVVCIVVFFIHRFILRRKGSYDTQEDLKPELLHFQNL